MWPSVFVCENLTELKKYILESASERVHEDQMRYLDVFLRSSLGTICHLLKTLLMVLFPVPELPLATGIGKIFMVTFAFSTIK